MFWITAKQKQLMIRIAAGWTLKSHRYLDGEKLYRLYPPEPEGEPEEVAFRDVQKLLRKRLLTTNQKFPAATFLLTTKGQKLISKERPKGVSKIVRFDT